MNSRAPIGGRIERTDLVSQAREAILAGIIEGALEGGEVLTVPDLAQRLGVSRTPAREAVILLQEQGHVEILRNRGLRVREIDEAYLRSVMQYRAALEGFAVRDLASRLDAADEEALLATQERQERAHDSEVVDWLHSTECLHRYVIAELGNELLQKAYADLADHYRRIGMLAAAVPGRRTRAISQHRRIVEALLNRDSAAAEREMYSHLMSLADDLSKVIRVQSHSVSLPTDQEGPINA